MSEEAKSELDSLASTLGKVLTVENICVSSIVPDENICVSSIVPDEILRRNPFARNNAVVGVRRELDRLVFTLRTYLLRSAHKTTHLHGYDVPATWWEQLKDEHFPVWLKARFPVRYERRTFPYEENTYLCPHGDFAWGHESHFAFLEQQPLDSTGMMDELLEKDDWYERIQRAVLRFDPNYFGKDLRESILDIVKRAELRGINQPRIINRI